MKFKSFIFIVINLTYFITLLLQAQDFFEKESNLDYRLGMINESNNNQLNSTPLNKDNKYVKQVRYGDYFSTDLFLSWFGFSAALKGKATYSDRDHPEYESIVRELYFDRAINDYLHFTIGRKILKWGTGYAFNPAGVVEPGKDAADPSDRLSRYQGKQVAVLDAYFGNNSFTLVYANEVKYKNKLIWDKHELAIRYYSLLNDIDLSFIAFWKEDEPSRFGFNTAYTYGSHLEVHSEYIAQIGTNKLYHLILNEPEYDIYFYDYPYAARDKNSNKIFNKLLLGAQYTFDSGLNIMVEYFYNREGLTLKEWNQWRRFTLFHQQQMTAVPPNQLSLLDFYNALYTLNERGTMRHYGYLRLYLPYEKSGVEASLFGNLIDGSGAGIITFNYYFSPAITGWIRAEYFEGPSNSEFDLMFIKSSAYIGIKISI